MRGVQCPVFLTNLEGKVGKVGRVGEVGKVGKEFVLNLFNVKCNCTVLLKGQ
jgi:hypothetical protein